MTRLQHGEAATALADIGADLYHRGWLPATSGNLSLRLGDDRALVTASGRHKGRLTADDFLVVDFAGQPVSGGRPSAETLLHTQIYRLLPEAGVVLHCHSPSATLLTRRLAGAAEVLLQDYELLKALPGIATHAAAVSVPILDNDQDMERLARRAEPHIRSGGCPAYLIRGHGIYVWAESAEVCLRSLEALDFMLQCEFALHR